ncbi:MAG: phosphoribosylamine--glycine ligase, partial [Pseudomonadota bacterium]
MLAPAAADDLKADDIEALVAFAGDNGVDLTIVGPEAPLVAGICDRFAAAGLPCFGPGAEAARLEGSKAYMKAFLKQHGIPTARYESFTELAPALACVERFGAPVVIKADGLAAGKGVIVAQSLAEARQAVTDMLDDGAFGDAGRCVVIEEFLHGEEASFIAMVDGQHILPLASSQDHKARDNGDLGPNTGGMGAYSPAPVVTPAVHDRILNDIMRPTVAALAAAGTPYVGFLYAGVMIDADGAPKVLEFNCRLGDPETQPLLFRLRSDLTALCEHALAGTLNNCEVEWDSRTSLGVVLAARGYPAAYPSGEPIAG